MPKERIEHLEMIAPGGIWSLWALTTTDQLKFVWSQGYFDRFTESGLRRHDRIMVTASANEKEPEYSEVVVMSNDRGRGSDAGKVGVKPLEAKS